MADPVIVSIENGYTTQKTNTKRVAVLYYKTTTDAEEDENLSEWANGTMCYTSEFDIGILNDGVWVWKG